MRIALRAPVPADVQIAIDAGRPLPIDWARWREAMVAATGSGPVPQVRELFTGPEGWAVTIVDVESTVHAFYALLDRAVHAVATGVTAATRDAVHAAFASAAPVWDDAIAALVDL